MVDNTISSLEHADLAQMGLGQYRDYRDMSQQLHRLANSPEFWDHFREQKRKQYVLDRAKAALISICDRQALQTSVPAGELASDARKMQRRWMQVPYAGAKYYLDFDSFNACEARDVSDAKAAFLASQHEIAEKLCDKLWQPASRYFAVKGIELTSGENKAFQEECMRLNSPVDAEWFVSRMHNGEFLRRDAMAKFVRNHCAFVGNGTPECRDQLRDTSKVAATLVAQQDQALAYCGKDFKPSGDGGAFFEYFECLRDRDPQYAMLRDMYGARKKMEQSKALVKERKRSCVGPPAKVAPDPAICWDASWNTDRGFLGLHVENNFVYGYFNRQINALKGTVSNNGREIGGTWEQSDLWMRKGGYFHFKLADDNGTRFTGGSWASESDFKANKPPKWEWSGTWLENFREEIVGR